MSKRTSRARKISPSSSRGPRHPARPRAIAPAAADGPAPVEASAQQGENVEEQAQATEPFGQRNVEVAAGPADRMAEAQPPAEPLGLQD